MVVVVVVPGGKVSCTAPQNYGFQYENENGVILHYLWLPLLWEIPIWYTQMGFLLGYGWVIPNTATCSTQIPVVKYSIY